MVIHTGCQLKLSNCTIKPHFIFANDVLVVRDIDLHGFFTQIPWKTEQTTQSSDVRTCCMKVSLIDLLIKCMHN